MKVSRIYLVGFMGVGKTTIGRLLAGRLGWEFIDLDAAIEAREKKSVRAIFDTSGEAHFRGVEKACLRQLSGGSERVISLGGGAYVDSSNRQLVESTGVSVYLEAPLEVLLSRIDDDGSRPLARNRSELASLFADRTRSYKMAQVVIGTGNREPAEVVEELLRVLGER
jgi:shikimate kinase